MTESIPAEPSGGVPGDDADGHEDEGPARKLIKDQIAEALRQQVDTVGRPGRPGAMVQNVISVGILSEGWDAKTVTHIMGLRAFTSQLLCEQVVGRRLRPRATSWDPFPAWLGKLLDGHEGSVVEGAPRAVEDFERFEQPLNQVVSRLRLMGQDELFEPLQAELPPRLVERLDHPVGEQR
jgi:hypothetical protein